MAQKKKKSNKTLYYIIGGIVVIIIVLLVGKSQGWIGKPTELEVELSKSKRVSIEEKVSASGTVQPVIEVKIAPEVSGEIIELNVEDGDSVYLGQSLVKIRPDAWLSQLERSEAALNQQRANVLSAEAGLSRSKATFIRAEADYKRQERLWNEKVISESDWQLAKQNFEVSKNDLASSEQTLKAAEFVVKSTEASVKEARENVRKTLVVAPMKGIISKLNVKKGERVLGTVQMQGTEMLRIADLRKMEVRVNVNENDIVRVHLNDSVNIDVDAYANQNNKRFKGIVTNIANTAKDKASADAITEFEVRILILSSSYDDLARKGNKYPFRPGMTASVEILTNKKDNVMSVPLAAVTTRNPNDLKTDGEQPKQGGPPNNSNRAVDDKQDQNKKKADKIVVFVNDKGTAKMLEVKTGISDYDNIEIIEGLKDSTEVVIGPFLAVSKRLKDGDKIRVKPKEDGNKDKKSDN
jgi:HlyD family secretion protein